MTDLMKQLFDRRQYLQQIASICDMFAFLVRQAREKSHHTFV